jgi:hypothetical protein
VNQNTLAFIRRANVALDKWWADCDELHRTLLYCEYQQDLNADIYTRTNHGRGFSPA